MAAAGSRQIGPRDSTSPANVGRSSRWWLALALAVAALVRIHVYTTYPTHTMLVSADSFSYLNLARHLRGVPVPAGWDSIANLPRHDQGARTPGYPLLLNLVFWLTGHEPTPSDIVDHLGRLDGWHRHFLATQENLRAVQAGQHLLGVLATWLAYATVARWTRRRWLAAVTSTAAVGLRPIWVAVFEPLVLSEVLAATLLLLCVWLMTRAEKARDPGMGPGLAASVLSGAAVLVRPALMVLPLLLALGFARLGRDRWLERSGLLCLPWLLVVGGWVVRNGIVWGFWGLSSISGLNLISHFAAHPESLDHPRIRALAEEYRGDRHAGLLITRALVTRDELSLPQASALLRREGIRAAWSRPKLYLWSALSAFKDGWLPTEAGIPASRIPPRLPPLLWRSTLAAYLVAGLTGVLVLVVQAPLAAKASMWIVLLSSAAISLMTNLESIRYSFPFQVLALMCAAVVIDRLLILTRPVVSRCPLVPRST